MDQVIISQEIRSIANGSNELSYVLERKNVRNINLRIKPDASVIVSAPEVIPAERVDDFVLRKISYIQKALSEINHISAASKRDYISGESFRLEGKNLRLKVIEANENSVTSDGIFLIIKVKDTHNVVLKEKLVKKYYTQKLKTVIGEIIDRYYGIFQKYDIAKPKLKYRAMQTRWGSCSVSTGTITINKHLIEAPRNCIEYVVMHEMCHLIYPDHSKSFYAFLSMQMPDWAERKRSLEDFLYC